MFKLKLNEARILTSSISVISDFITEATFNVSPEGVKLVAMDPANISMVILDILPSAFTNYSVSEKEEVTVNLESLKQALKRAKPSEPVSLTIEKNKLVVVIYSKSVKRYLIPLLEKEAKEKQIPDLNFNTIVEMNANEFRDYVEDASIVGDALTFDATPDKLVLSAGEAGSRVSIELEKNSDALVKLEVKEAVRAIYSVEYLKKIARAATLADVMTAQFSADYPLKLDFKALNQLQMSFILAPRIENK